MRIADKAVLVTGQSRDKGRRWSMRLFGAEPGGSYAEHAAHLPIADGR